ncbi:MAG: MoaD/ThiS family protein [Bryobacteraceae bacterium]|nr:MoaD/ThiS family protein [Bryobacteraceae bacterium]
MITVRFTRNLQRHVACPTLRVMGATVREAMQAYFHRYPAVRGYVLDDQGRLRQHMAIFIDGRQLRDATGLSDPVPPDAEIDIIQSLSGG